MRRRVYSGGYPAGEWSGKLPKVPTGPGPGAYRVAEGSKLAPGADPLPPRLPGRVLRVPYEGITSATMRVSRLTWRQRLSAALLGSMTFEVRVSVEEDA